MAAENILNALNSLPVAELTREEWIKVGMALKEEGYPCSVWDDWSRNDERYHAKECERLWKGFGGAGRPVRGGSIIELAKQHGWDGISQPLEWDDYIEDDSNGFTGFPSVKKTPVEELIEFLETIFQPDEYVGYVTNDAWQNEEGKWVPSKGNYDRTASQLIAALKKHPDDMGAAMGDAHPEAGAWIRFNALDGQGVADKNVVSFRYALVESDDMTIEEQREAYRKLELPIATLTHSGGKSLHALVRVDAKDKDEYGDRVNKLYDFLEAHGVKVDRQNKNPSRMTRMPGVKRGDGYQHLLATNIGRKNWTDWMDFVEGLEDTLPDIESIADYAEPPEMAPPLIDGVLRQGHKMLVSGSSKAGKSCLLMELAVDIAEGLPWMGFTVRQGKVLYINLEIDKATAINRIFEIYDALNAPRHHPDNLLIWNLRGKALPMDKLVPKLVRRIKDMGLSAVIVDPIYKVITGDENNASEMGAFCNQFDKICDETGCSVIYCHHHSKGAQGQKRVMDRASGSGVFARDPDALIDLVALELTETQKNEYCGTGESAYRVESNLREFAPFKPKNVWFKYPLHIVDAKGVLSDAPEEGTSEAGRIKNGRSSTTSETKAKFRTAYDVNNTDGTGVLVKDLAKYLERSEKTVEDQRRSMKDEFGIKDHKIFRWEDTPEK